MIAFNPEFSRPPADTSSKSDLLKGRLDDVQAKKQECIQWLVEHEGQDDPGTQELRERYLHTMIELEKEEEEAVRASE